MEFPETQTLSAGMKWSVPVTFRPVAKECYEDKIEFSTSFGTFYLPIKASLPEHLMEFPEEIDFGYCPIRETAKFTFQMNNVGELASDYEWKIDPPFSIMATTGMLEPGTSCNVHAMVISATAICCFGTKKNWDKSKVVKAAKVSGISKFSHIIIEGGQSRFDFSNVFVGTSAEKTMILKNPSAVHANFKIKKADKDADTFFEFSSVVGRIEANGKTEIKIKYSPVAAGLHSNSYFEIVTLSGNITKITCSGCGMGPNVSIEPSIINFNDVSAGTLITRAMYLKNESTLPCFFEFLSPKDATFKIDKRSGTIGPNSTIALQVQMCPKEPMNYYRRVYCLVEHQDAIYVDIIGTCYNDSRRPATFKYSHIVHYNKRVENGLWEFGPEQLEDMIKSDMISCKNGVLQYTDPLMAEKKALNIPIDHTYPNAIVCSEYFYKNTGETLPCVLLDSYIDFGSCSRYRVIEPQIIRVSNRTKGKMTCVWTEDNSSDEPLFLVTPKVADIPSKSIGEFKVQFRPKVDSEFYGKQLECFCYFKSMRNFRLVNQDTFTPPWCLTPKVAGNTFPPGEDTFIPKIEFDRTKVVFPPCYVDRSQYQTIKISNTGDTSVKFSFLDLGLDSQLGIGGSSERASNGGPIFSVKPRIGVLKKNETRLIVLRFSPSREGTYEDSFTCYFNNSTQNTYSLHLRGFGAYPKLSFGKNNSLNFKPTCIGSVAARKFHIRNTSKTSVHFEWKIPKHYLSVVGIQPTSGKLDADAVMELQCIFSPTISTYYNLKIPCYYFHEAEDSSKQRATFVVNGRGMHGELRVEKDTIDFENILINTLTEKEVIVYNPSDCDIYYSLELKDSQNNLIARSNDTTKGSEFQIVQKSNYLASRSHEAVRVKACLKSERKYEMNFFYKISRQEIELSEGVSLPIESKKENIDMKLCSIKAMGVHPIMAVRDIRSEGISKTILWQLFSLDRFNELLEEPSTDPGAFAENAMDDDTFTTDAPPINLSSLEADVNFDFGATTVGSTPTYLKISLKNCGVVPVDWGFNFPNDFEAEIEQWADPGDFTEEQKVRNFILDNNIFCVSPKYGSLQPNEMVHVMLSYSHEFQGPHRLPVVFKLKNGTSRSGKDILINFIGYSVPASQKFLHLQSINYRLEPVKIGTEVAPIQLNKANLNHPIIRSLKNKGQIEPGKMDYLEFIFNPLEEKSYEVDLPITVDSGKTKMITLRGCGQHQNLRRFITKSDPAMMKESIPQFPSLPPLLKPIASISLERLDYGNVPIYSIMRQILVVQNMTFTDTISFKWIIPELTSKVLSITPMSYTLNPGESRVCKVTFTPDKFPRLYHFDIICEIKQYHIDNPTEEERIRMEGELLAQSGMNLEAFRNKKQKQLGSLKRNANSGNSSNIKKYKPLPSITPPLTANKDIEPIALEEPKPINYFIGVRARSHIVDEFKCLFTRYDNCNIP
ncbi:hypothetical protein HDV02_001454 [Globomyces sp. JEL0801]|nr:hypothetical protein HDV02_001454 [Globomyces sp. JEL0801]